MKIFKGITKNVFALGIVSFLTDFSSEMIYPLLPLFLTSVLGASTSFLGFIEGIAESTASVLKLFSGWLSDKLNKRKAIVVFGYTLSSISRPLIAIVSKPFHVLLIRFSDRVGKGLRTSPRDALIADSVDKEHYGKAFGFQRALDNLGGVVGPLAAFALLSFYTGDLRLVFAFSAIPAVITVIILVLFVQEKKRSSSDVKRPPTLTLKPFDTNFKLYMLIVLFFTLGNSSDAFLILRARDCGVPISLIPIIWVVLHVVKTLSSMPGGILSDRAGRKPLIVAGWFIYGLVYLGFGFATQSWHVWVLFAVYGLYYGLTEGVEKALIADLVPSNLRATAFGIYYFAVGIAAFPSSWIMGIIWQKFGVVYAFSFGAVMSFIAASMFIVLVKTKTKDKKLA